MASETQIVNNTVASAWTNPDNAHANDGSCTNHTSSNSNNDYNFTNPAFNIPAGATIDGIEVKVEHGENDGNDYLQVGVMDSGLTQRSKDTPNNNAGSCAGVTLATLGGSTDKWGGTWTAAHINSSSFEVRIRSKASAKSGGGWWVDYVEVTVYYTEAVSARRSKRRLKDRGHRARKRVLFLSSLKK